MSGHRSLWLYARSRDEELRAIIIPHKDTLAQNITDAKCPETEKIRPLRDMPIPKNSWNVVVTQAKACAVGESVCTPIAKLKCSV